MKWFTGWFPCKIYLTVQVRMGQSALVPSFLSGLGSVPRFSEAGKGVKLCNWFGVGQDRDYQSQFIPEIFLGARIHNNFLQMCLVLV